MKKSSAYRPLVISTDERYSSRYRPFSFGEPKYVRVKMTCLSICNTDRRAMRRDKGGAFGAQQFPVGHEGGGERLDSGEKVVVLPHFLRSGAMRPFERLPNLSPQMLHLGLDLPGLMADYVDVPESCLLSVGEKLPSDDALGIVEPLACASRCLSKLRTAAKSTPIRRLGLVGGGPMATLLALNARRLFPLVEITIVEPNPTRNAMLQSLGVANRVVTVPADLAFDASIVASSALAAYQSAVRATARGGIVMMFSGINSSELESATKAGWLGRYFEAVHRAEAEIAPSSPYAAGRRLIGSSGYTRDDVEQSVDELATSFEHYQLVQNVVIDGLASTEARVVRPNPQTLKFSGPAIEDYLAPSGICDPEYGEVIAQSLKVVVRVDTP